MIGQAEKLVLAGVALVEVESTQQSAIGQRRIVMCENQPPVVTMEASEEKSIRQDEENRAYNAKTAQENLNGFLAICVNPF